MNLTHRLVWVGACALALAGCGGGGDGGGTPPAPSTYTVGGTVTGLSGTGLVLQNMGGGNLAVTAGGAFTFSSTASTGSAYSVTVLTQPSSPSQTCTVTGGTGTVGSANVNNVTVACTTNSYTVGGTVTGLVATGLVLQNNAGSDLTISAAGAFTFPAAVASGAAYSVTVKTQPTVGPLQSCSVTNGSGTVTAAAVTAVSVTCAYQTAKFLYSANSGSNSISGYGINAATGALTALAGMPVPSDISPVFIASNPSRNALYVATNGSAAAPPRISAYAVNTISGLLTPIAGSPFDLSHPPPPNGYAPVTRPLVHPSGNYGYMGVIGTGPIYGATADSAGVLTEITGLPAAGTGQLFGAFDPTGNFLYIPHNNLNGGVGGAISIYRTATSGALTSLGSVATGGMTPSNVIFTPSGSFVLSVNQQGSVAVLATNGAGGLAPVTGSPFSTSGSTPTALALHPTKNFVYVTNGGTSPTPSTIAAFTLDPTTGVLSPVAGSPFQTGGTVALGGRVDPTGRFYYVTNSNNNVGNGSIAAFNIDQATGALSPVAGSPFTTDTGPTVLVMDPSGRYVYSVNTFAGTISSFAVNLTTGALALVNTVPAGSSPRFPELFGLQ